jgi:hypothetical protein
MSNKITLQEDNMDKNKSVVNQTGEKGQGTSIPGKVSEKKQKKPVKKSHGVVPSSIGESAVDAVKAHSSRDVRGSSGLANTGTIISYD